MTTDHAEEPLTYGSYLRVPELLQLQTPLGHPAVHDEMLFIVGQQVQELWFKQILHDLRSVVDMLQRDAILEAANLIDRLNRILRVLGAETEVLESLPPRQFHRFRGYLKAASGFESQQFRELEIASGLRTETYLKMVSRFVDLEDILRRWPASLADAFRHVLTQVAPTPLDAITAVYEVPDDEPGVYLLCEALSEYEHQFIQWRFHHVHVVERVIGDRAPGSAGSSGLTYLTRTMSYRFFPELWEARNRLTVEAKRRAPGE